MTRIDVVKIELVKEKTMPYDGARKISSPDDAATILRQFIGNADREVFVALLLSTKRNVNAIHTVGIGTLDASLAHPREVFKAAVVANAQSIIVGHNHPSGDCTPSEEDQNLTHRLFESGKILGIGVLDHVVIGDCHYFSFHKNGMLG